MIETPFLVGYTNSSLSPASQYCAHAIKCDLFRIRLEPCWIHELNSFLIYCLCYL